MYLSENKDIRKGVNYTLMYEESMNFRKDLHVLEIRRKLETSVDFPSAQ